MRALAVLVAMVVAAVRPDQYHPSGPAWDPPPRLALPETSAEYWRRQAQEELAARVGGGGGEPGAGAARNVVLFLGDGMSVPTLAAARTLLGQRAGGSGEEAQLHFESFPTVGLAKTYCVNAQVADSACTATAYLCGVKANRGTLGVSAAVRRGDCAGAAEPDPLSSLADWALADGRDAGIVTTTRVTHASPAGLYAKAADREWETDADVTAAGHEPDACPDITRQLVGRHPGDRLKVILGGGRRTFLPHDVVDEEGSSGRRRDGRDLIEEWRQDKRDRNVTFEYVWNRKQLMALNDDPPEYLLGLFESSHMRYHLEADPDTEPTLAELTEAAIRTLRRNPRGFFLFVEGGRIDHAHHGNRVHLALDETIEMDKAVARATQLLSEEDSLVVVTADHAHVMAFNGYSARGRDILGRSGDRDRNRVPYMTLSYTNGPGARAQREGVRPDVTADPDYGSRRWRTHADVPLSSETHGGDDVAVFAWGPQHALFTGLYEQHQLPHRMAYAACIGPGLHACSEGSAARP